MPELKRRGFMTGAAAITAFPSRAQTLSWDSVSERAGALGQCHAIMVHQNGREVLSDVFRGPGLDRLVPIKSVSKTVVAALTGAALDRGEIPATSSTIAELAPQLIPDGADARVGTITVENLLTMQTGLERTSGPNYGAWVSSRNWVSNALSRPFVAEPGSRMLYSTGSFHVLGALLSEVSGLSLLALARQRLGDPLDIEIPAWTRDPQGRYLGGNEMALTVPGMVRFGEVYRRSGKWEDKRVLSDGWVDRSFVPKTKSPWSGLLYGYGWFLGGSGDTRFALARGYGGQVICVVPHLALTVAISSDPTRPARSGGYFGDLMHLIEATILPVAKRELA